VLTRVLLKIQNTYERTVFADVLERTDAIMHVREFVESVRRFFESIQSAAGLISTFNFVLIY
jgi:hypothetical protein